MRKLECFLPEIFNDLNWKFLKLIKVSEFESQNTLKFVTIWPTFL